MIVSLFTTRETLRILGEIDFGIYNVVCGVVVLFTFINMALSISTQRFLNIEIGKGNSESVRRVFSVSMTCHLLIALFVLVFSETVGLWFLNYKMNIPETKMVAAQWVYQFSVLGSCVSIIRVPYNACIIAYEKMSFFAYVSILEAVLKLATVYILLVIVGNYLIVYGILLFVVITLITWVYKIYCNRKFPVSRYRFVKDVPLLKQILSFSGWSLFGSAANVGANQGIAIILNIFCGVIANAAMGIANQVSAAVNSFVTNFQTAFVPQLMQSYSANEHKRFISMIFQTSKFSYYLLFIVSLPVFICCDYILHLWLNEVPQYTVEFSRLIICFSLIDALSTSLWLGVQAIGDIKKYQMLMSFLILSSLPLAYCALYLGFAAPVVLLVRVVVNFITHIVRMFYLKRKIVFPVGKYCWKVMLPCLVVSLISFPIPFFIYETIGGLNGTLLTFVCSVLLSTMCIFAIGIDRSERQLVLSRVRQFVAARMKRG